jgi:hypothetical protein
MNKRLIIIIALTALLAPALFGGWSEMQRLTYRGYEMMPQVVARHDTVHVVWEYDIHDAQICYVRSTDNGLTWGDITNLTESGHIGYYPRLAITDSAIWVCWMDNNLESIAITSSANGDTWSTPIYIYTIDSQRWEGLGMVVSNDSIYLIYLASTRDSTGLKPYKLLRSYDRGNTWSNLMTFAHTNSSNLALKSYYCQNALLVAVTTVPDTLLGGYHIIGYISIDAGQTWSDTMWISPYQWYTAQQPCISCNQVTGQFAVGYMDYRYQQYAFYGDIFIRLSTDDPTQWGYEAQVTNEHTAKYPSVSFRGSSLMAVWSDSKYFSAGNDEIFFNSSNNGGVTWDSPERLTNTQSKSIYPWICNINDTIHVVWYEYNIGSGDSCDIYYMKYTPDSSDIINTENEVPSSLALSAYPNPFNSTLSINITAQEAGTIYITDILGRFVTELKYPEGLSILKWDATYKNGKALPSGAYFIKNKGGGYKDVLKVMYLK